ncbi:MAG: TMEM175 family protein [Candidatus Nanopelagicales bacterium]|jgi:uncharacterized membrane protein
MSRRGIQPPERIVAFSDGVVAIAITLLLLPLAELELPSDGRITTLIGENTALLGGLTLTWVIIAIFWLAHHRLFAHIVGVDQMIMWMNFGWLFAIAVLPLPTNLDIANPPTPQVTGFYVGWMLLISLLQTGILWHARRTPGLMDEEYKDSQEARAAQVRGLLVTAVFGLSFVVAFIQPEVATFVLILLFFLDPVAGRIARARG